MSRRHPYSVSDEDDDLANSSDDIIDLIDDDFDSDSEFEIIGVHSRDRPSTPSKTCFKRQDTIRLPETTIRRYTLENGCVIRVGDTIEMHDPHHAADSMHSNDFLRVKFIIKNLEIDKVYLRGHRMKRTKYMAQLFHWKLNELAMFLRVPEADTRCPFVAGLEDVAVEDVLRTRKCTLTNKPYPFLSFRDGERCSFPASFSKREIKEQIFHGGLLACRAIQVSFISKNGKPYSGIVRRLHATEADGDVASAADNADQSADKPIHDLSRSLSTLGRRARSMSDDCSPRKRRSPPMPTKATQFTFADAFCCSGGASQGAKQAGYSVRWGMDCDRYALQAYFENHPGALPISCNAHDFPPEGYTGKMLRVDVLHLSPPCCFFSPANTRKYSAHGSANDQANLEALFTVGPILQVVKPRVATLEQTFGLSTFKEHQKYFLMLLNDITQAGYNLRYKLEDLSRFGLVQQRKRLLIIAARHGTPLPPFPKPTHGPPGSGLKDFHTIRDALLPIERLGSRSTDDQYHQPKLFKNPKEPYDPRRFLKGCITKGGGVNYHPSGLRNFTPRELGLLQSFPVTYKFCGPQTEAMQQVGNAFPPIMAEAMFRTIAKTLEAFDNGLISEEDDIDDIDSTLERRGVRLQTRPAVPQAQRQALFHALPQPSTIPYRYLVRDENPGASRAAPTYESPFVRNAGVAPQPARTTVPTANQHMDFLDGLYIDLEESDSDEVRESIESRRDRRPPETIRDASSDIIEISSDSEGESESDEDEDEEEDGDDSWVHVRT